MTALACLSVSGAQLPLSLLEQLSYSREELAGRLPALRAATVASGLAILSTCQRTELYATWEEEPDPEAMLLALGVDRGVRPSDLRRAAHVHVDEHAARHLLRVATGLESFVLGESEIAGQVRTAAAAVRAVGTGDLELERLLGAAIAASRRAHRGSSLPRTGRSVATAAVDAVAARNGGTLAGKRLLVVGAGSVATAVVSRAAELGGTLTVSNRTRRHAELLRQWGARVVDLSALTECLADTDVAILATAATHALVDGDSLRRTRHAAAEPLLLLDLCVPRNVAPSVRDLPGVDLIDLADLRASGASAAEHFEEDVAQAEQAVEHELRRYLRWRTARVAHRLGAPVVGPGAGAAVRATMGAC